MEVSDSGSEGRRLYQNRIQGSVWKSPLRNVSNGGRLPEFWSPRQSDSRSPVRQKEGRQYNGPNLREYYRYPSSHHRNEGKLMRISLILNCA